MNKLVLFFIVVFVGVALMLVVSNQTTSKSLAPAPLTLNLTPSPTPQANNQPENPTPTIIEPQKQATPTGSTAVIKTSKGDITISFFQNDAKNTVKNFITKANAGFYNNLTFHRVEDWVIQGGDPKGNGTGGGTMPTELNDHPFVAGSVGVARGGDIRVSNDAQFFITKTEASHLNGQYINFGQVTSGMDVVEKIEIGDKIIGITTQ